MKHRVFEDILGILVGTFAVSLGLFLLKSGAAVTGGTAGLSLLLSYAIPIPFGVLFFLVNLPFFLVAIHEKGWNFALRSCVSVLLVSALAGLHPAVLQLGTTNALYTAVAGNVLCGVGILILFRHKSSLGGFNIVALISQDRFGLRAGYVLMVLDTIVVLSSLAVVPLLNVILSALGVVILSLILALNHRPGRYLGA